MEPVALGFVAEVVDGAAVGVEVGDVLKLVSGEKQGADGEVFVVGLRQAAGVGGSLVEAPGTTVEGENGGHGFTVYSSLRNLPRAVRGQ